MYYYIVLLRQYVVVIYGDNKLMKYFILRVEMPKLFFYFMATDISLLRIFYGSVFGSDYLETSIRKSCIKLRRQR